MKQDLNQAVHQDMMVTPQMATKWLEMNLDNRHLRQGHIDNLAGAMLRGEWRLIPHGIILAKDGRVIDGQHRLWAIVQSGCTVPLHVTTECDYSVREHIDKGVIRTLADLYGLDRTLASIANFFSRTYWTGAQKGKPSSVQSKEIADAIGPYVAEMLESCSTRVRYFSSTPVQAACILSLMMNKEHEYVLAIYGGMVRHQWHALPPVCSAFNRQIMELGVRSHPASLYTRALTVFDPSCRNQQRILVKETTVPASVALTRKVLGKHLPSQAIKRSKKK